MNPVQAAGARPGVHQVLATLGYGDAIGHEVLGIQRVLRKAGFLSEIFVETADPRLEALTHHFRELLDYSRPDNLIIHHFSIGSKASRMAYALPDRMMLVYHNITPPEFFAGVQQMLAALCFQGRRELQAYSPRCELAAGDSEFNRQELAVFGFSATAVLPVVPDFSHLDVTPNRLMADRFDDAWRNVLFVGRIVPHKKIEDLIRFFHAYKAAFNPRSRLLIVGSYDGLDQYVASLHQFAAELGVSDIHFIGQVTDEELTAYYDVADLFLCASEHEGFCVPLVEAFYKEVPVLAYAATAVPSTMDGAGVLYDTKDPERVAALMDAVLSDPALEEAVVAGQLQALARLRARDFGGTLLGLVERARTGPRRPPVRIVPDFWSQFQAVERLEELRQYRPAIYKALPERP